MTEIGFVGLETMGGRMVERLLAAGHPVTGWNRTRSRVARLIEKGMRVLFNVLARMAGVDGARA